MARTKIINVQQSDSLEDVFSIFQDTPADEVIFIIPKRSAFSKNPEAQLTALFKGAEKLGKTVSIMADDPAVAQAARGQGFSLLGGAQPSATLATAPEPEEDDTDDEMEAPEQEEQEDDVETEEEEINEDEEDIEEEPNDDTEEDDEDIEEDSEEPEDAEDETDEPEAQLAMETEDEEEDQQPFEVSLAAAPRRKKKSPKPKGKVIQDIVTDDADKQEDVVELQPKRKRSTKQAIPVADAAPEQSAQEPEPQEQEIEEPEPQAPEQPQEEHDAAEVESEPEAEEAPEQEQQEPVEEHEEVEPEQEENELQQPLDHEAMVRHHAAKQAAASTTPQVDIERLWSEEARRERKHTGQSHNFAGTEGSKRRFLGKTPLIIIGITVIVLAVIAYLVLGSASVTITPVRQDVQFTLEASASTTIDDVQLEFDRVPGQLFEVEKTISEVFPVTGSKEVAQKARGEITIFNTGAADQKLIATTRFESPDGLIFRIPETVTVPGGSPESPGTIGVTVFADSPGSDYNIEPARFTIPGFEGGPQFELFYAVSEEAMTGGVVGPAATVTESDYATAAESIEESLREQIVQDLQAQASSLMILDSIDITIEDPISVVGIGEAADELELTISGRVQTMAFNPEHAFALIENQITQSGELTVTPADVTVEYVNPTLTDNQEAMQFDIQVNGSVPMALDITKIESDILGMNGPALEAYFDNDPNVGPVTIKLSPFWVRSIPNDPDKVEITIE